MQSYPDSEAFLKIDEFLFKMDSKSDWKATGNSLHGAISLYLIALFYTL